MELNKDSLNPSNEDGLLIPQADFLNLANDANDSGDKHLSLYLYLAAFQAASKKSTEPSEDAIAGLKKAWTMACDNKERSLAEYIFDLMEPYLSNDELEACADRLQDLAFDKLSEIGLSREDLEMMAEGLADEVASIGVQNYSNGHFGGLFSFVGTAPSESSTTFAASSDNQSFNSVADPIDGSLVDAVTFNPSGFSYSNLAGYANFIALMKDSGIGEQQDGDYHKLIEMLNHRHGLTTSPSPDTFLFRSDVREDANRFMLATVGEINLPSIHMRMEEGFQGSPILCISSFNINTKSSVSMKDALANGGVLVLENLDLWESPVIEPADDGIQFLYIQMTRGAREAISLIRHAVDNPSVYVFATASNNEPIDEFFLELLEPISFVDIALPDSQDRLDIWMDICKNHPSLRHINKDELVKYSSNMARFDIYMAARDAIEEAYKASISAKTFVPVSRDNLFDKLAGYHPLESDEYSKLEDEVVRDFQKELSRIDDLLI